MSSGTSVRAGHLNVLITVNINLQKKVPGYVSLHMCSLIFHGAPWCALVVLQSTAVYEKLSCQGLCKQASWNLRKSRELLEEADRKQEKARLGNTRKSQASQGIKSMHCNWTTCLSQSKPLRSLLDSSPSLVGWRPSLSETKKKEKEERSTSSAFCS